MNRGILPSAAHVLAIVALVALGTLTPSPVEAAGPWKARIIDGGTRAPLQGVAVLAVWERQVSGHPPIPIGVGEAGYFASDEATSGPDGWFTLAARTLFNPSLALKVEGPKLYLFKAGYGSWRFVGDATRLIGQSGLIEMQPLGSREERLRYFAEQSNPLTIPFERAQRFEAAINAERAALGLLPIGIGYPGLWSDQPQPRIPLGAEHVALEGATAVARDRFGFLYVADTDHHRVVKLTPALAVVAAWGRFGRLDGEFQYPRGIAVDRRGIVYVGDSANHRIQTFTTDGRFLTKFGELRYNQLGGGFSPTDVAVTAGGEVVAYTSGTVFRFTTSGRLLGQWQFDPGNGVRFSSRAGIGVDGRGHIYGIVDDPRPGRPRLRRFSAGGRELGGWARRGSGPGQLFDPMGIAIDSAGRVYVADADQSNPRVMVFASDGRFLHQWDVKSGTAPELQWPYGLAVDGRGTVFIADMKRPRLHQLVPPRR